MTMGIYALRNTATGKVYIGSSCKLEARHQNHRWALNGAHPHPELRADAQRYGSAAFEWVILEEVSEEWALRSAEQRWLDNYAARQPAMLYNRERRVSRSDVVRRPARLIQQARKPKPTEEQP
jgi:hypothetical protein